MQVIFLVCQKCGLETDFNSLMRDGFAFSNQRDTEKGGQQSFKQTSHDLNCCFDRLADLGFIAQQVIDRYRDTSEGNPIWARFTAAVHLSE
jgi:hypothetical protein